MPMSDPGLVSRLSPLTISAPFGNYVQPARCTATLGTFTAMARGGRVWRIVRTVRYYRRLRAWVNRIGLRNPGIDWLGRRVEAGRIDVSDKLVSIHGLDAAQWRELVDRTAAMRPLAIELNMSCPNVGEVNWPADLFGRAAGCGVPVVVKLPPVNYRMLFEQSIAAGLDAFHCCNTLPVPGGGLSGKPLLPVALQCIRELKAAEHRIGRKLTIVGGGGITEPADIDAYAEAGADRFAVGTMTMNPKYLWTHRALEPLIERADEHTAG
jgi:dihydroorotate dehydrogenase